MTDPRPELHLRYVLLPWAQPEVRSESTGKPGQALLRDKAAVASVNRDHRVIQKQKEPDLQSRARDRARHGVMPPLPRAVLPFRPHPSIPDADRSQLEPRALVSLAVVLDVLATRIRKIPAGSNILADLTHALLEVGALGGIDKVAEERLLSHAVSRAGQVRASLSRKVVARMQATALPEAEITTTEKTLAIPSTPRAVSRAIKRIEAATDVVLHEARLRLEAQEKTSEFRQ